MSGGPAPFHNIHARAALTPHRPWLASAFLPPAYEKGGQLHKAGAPFPTHSPIPLPTPPLPPASLPPAYEKGGQLHKALAAFEEQLTVGIEPDIITYSSLVSACERAGERG